MNAQPRYSNQKQPRPFIKLYDDDKEAYYDLVDITELPQSPDLTVKVVRQKLINILATRRVHITTRTRLESLIRGNISRDSIEKFLDAYEARLVAVSPDFLPDETIEQYASRTNIPIEIVELKVKEETEPA